jgi:MFS family permease
MGVRSFILRPMNGLIRRLYAYRFLDDFILIYPLYQVMFAGQGLNLVEISWLFVIWSVTSIAAEVPTGVLADRYSRKNLLALGQLIRAAGFGFWLSVPNFWGFAAGFALWGVGSAFDSGTYQALLFDELKHIGRQQEYVRIQGRAQSFSLVGVLLASVGASVAFVTGYTGLLWFSIAATVVAAVVAFTIPQAPRQEDTGEATYFQDLWAGAGEAIHTPGLLHIIALGGFMAALYGSLEEYTPLFFQSIGTPVQLIPLAEAMLVLLTVGASLVAHRYEKLSTSAFLIILAMSGLMLVTGGWLGGYASAVLVGGFFAFTKLLEVIYEGKLQHGISSHRRATITSVSGFLAEIMSIGMFLGFGAIAEQAGTVAALGWFGGLVVVVAAVYLGLGRRVFRPA